MGDSSRLRHKRVVASFYGDIVPLSRESLGALSVVVCRVCQQNTHKPHETKQHDSAGEASERSMDEALHQQSMCACVPTG